MPLTPLNGLYRSFKARQTSKAKSDEYVKPTEDRIEDSASVLSDATTLAQSKTGSQKGSSLQQGPDSIDYGSTQYSMRGMSTRA
ncbi:uncharacterized protein BO87DRAFT_421991 [Aspergillus neoniger CBS 115656]|uniref:Uncharacterized protein n=1 Tax=Aspergillus neoniger (strain CBS 115656) TaxID=1448310 RepID=A0A318YWN0_ASPNB|nr:hypothetical protein BO87DRAFT_421991 [Aspergillus neoniger CBS 115656]PYH38879.1 hypothetical protein BO87DRAFT_421991 [Aspergillus neoniger CBS 115656]